MYKNKKVIHIVCMDELGGIGKGNKLLFNIPKDLKYFRDKTIGHACLCGRKTYESFPKTLSRRIIRNISSRCGDRLVDGLQDCWVHSNMLNTNSIYIIGGASIYNQTADITDELLITIVDTKAEADTFYTIPEGFIKVWESGVYRSADGLNYKFTKWKKGETL